MRMHLYSDKFSLFPIIYVKCILLAVLELNQIVHSQKLIHANISLGPGLRN